MISTPHPCHATPHSCHAPLIEQALWLLGHPSGPADDATDAWPLPSGARSREVIVDVRYPMRPKLNLGPNYLGEVGEDEDAPLELNPNWQNVDALIRYMMGPTEWCNSNHRVASGQTRGKALQERFWCCLQACEMYAAEFDASVTIHLDGTSTEETVRAAVAYVLTALNLVKLRASLLHTSGSWT